MNNLFAKLKLQSPFWQGVGVIVSIFALIISTFIAYDIYKKSLKFSDLTIVRDYSYSINSNTFGGDSSNRVTLSIDGEIASNVKVFYYRLTNTGNTPITPSDYVEPIKVSIDKPFKILAAKKIWSNRKSIKATWSKLDDSNFQLKPLLLNPDDSFVTLVFVCDRSDKLENINTKNKAKESSIISDSNISDQSDISPQIKVIPEPAWTARIVNISDLKITSNEQRNQAEARSMGIFYTTFYHTGWSVYRFAALTFILFVLGLFLGVQFGILQKSSLLSYVLLSVLMGLSIVAGDNFASRINGVQSQPLISNISLILYLLLIAFFTFPAVKKSLRKNTRPTNSP